MDTIRLCAATRDLLGEAPVWVARERALRWVDIDGRRSYRYDPATGEVSFVDYGEEITCVVPRRGGGFLCTFADGFAELDDAARFLRWLARPSLPPDHKFNDGGVDPAGRFYCGTMNTVSKEQTGALYRLERDGSASQVLHGVSTSNSLAWSPAGDTLYYCDTNERTIRAYDYNPASGRIGAMRTFADAEADAAPGKPDGSAVDCQGFVWNARWRGWSVARFVRDGSLDRLIALPVKCPTCCAFGGDDLKTLYVTTATKALSAEEIEAQPFAGGLLSLDVDVPGLECPEADY
ncbi:SMP-30/gluconolactonase/LRE family protein [Mesorhizobium xinjiangense]|uniref:SMP-30/gluconolactonase/LRE family protein n=1 Tax=Mesorhizobium xinjiangense TaxID=2678685 RepID=UPI0012EE767B|nr:SMP-30/gluconolactonase/LRE family protein [Mesorhizobium xinjiangense]